MKKNNRYSKFYTNVFLPLSIKSIDNNIRNVKQLKINPIKLQNVYIDY